MATRYERIGFARQIINDNPNISKRSLQVQIKQEYGVGLSDTTRRQLLQEASVPSVLRRHVTILHNARILNLRETKTLRKMVHSAGNSSYVRKIINKLWADGLAMHRQGLSGGEIRRELKREAKKNGLIASRSTITKKNPLGKVRGQIDFWKMLKRQRDDDIKSADYEPPPGSRGGKRPTSQKGNVIAQKARYQDKQNEKTHERWVEREKARLQTWIRQKQRAIDFTSSTERRRELISQRLNLEQTLRSIR